MNFSDKLSHLYLEVRSHFSACFFSISLFYSSQGSLGNRNGTAVYMCSLNCCSPVDRRRVCVFSGQRADDIPSVFFRRPPCAKIYKVHLGCTYEDICKLHQKKEPCECLHVSVCLCRRTYRFRAEFKGSGACLTEKFEEFWESGALLPAADATAWHVRCHAHTDAYWVGLMPTGLIWFRSTLWHAVRRAKKKKKSDQASSQRENMKFRCQRKETALGEIKQRCVGMNSQAQTKKKSSAPNPKRVHSPNKKCRVNMWHLLMFEMVIGSMVLSHCECFSLLLQVLYHLSTVFCFQPRFDLLAD